MEETEREETAQGGTDGEETDHESLHRDLEDQGDDMQQRRDELDTDADRARQEIRSKVSDQRVPGAQDEQEEVIHGREAVEGEDEDDSEDEESEEEDREDEEEDGEDDSEGGGSEGAGYREDEE